MEKVTDAKNCLTKAQYSSRKLMSIAEIITACTAIAALLLAAYQPYENRKHNRILLKPCLTQHRQIVNRKALKVTIQNVGLGPAEILSFKYEVNGNFYDDLSLAIKDSPMPIHVKSLSAFSAKPGAVIPATRRWFYMKRSLLILLILRKLKRLLM